MTRFAVILFAALALTFAGASALQANPGPPGPPSYIPCLIRPPNCRPTPPDCRRVPPGPPVKCVTLKPTAQTPPRMPPGR